MNNTDSPNKEKPKTTTQKKPTMHEKALPNKTTQEAMAETDRGEVSYYESVSAFFKSRKSASKEKLKPTHQKKLLSLKERLSMYETALPYKTKREERVDAAWDSVKPVGKELM